MKNTQKGFVIPLIITIVVILVVAGSVYYTKSKNSDRDLTQDNPDWKSYKSDEIGIEFNYPSVWGTITEEFKDGWKEDATTGLGHFQNCDHEMKLHPTEPCRNVYLSASNLSNLATYNIFFISDPRMAPQGGFASHAGWIKDQKSISSICSEGSVKNPKRDVLGCQTYTTKNNIIVSRARFEEVGDFENSIKAPYFVYFIYSPNTVFPGISFTAKEADRSDMDQVIESLKFVSK